MAEPHLCPDGITKRIGPCRACVAPAGSSAAYRLADDQFPPSEKLGDAIPENGDPHSVYSDS